MSLKHRSIRLLLATAFSLGLLFIIVGVVSAHTTLPNHAKVDGSDPKGGSTISTPPTTVTVHTAENMKPGAQYSNLFVYGPGGELISQGDAKVSLNNPQQMSVAIKPEKNGIYVVRWITVSATDGDPDQGAFTFTVNPNTSTTSAPAKQTTTPAPTTSGTPVWVPILVGIVALLAGLGAGVAFGRRTTPTTVATSPNRTVPEPERTPTQRP